MVNRLAVTQEEVVSAWRQIAGAGAGKVGKKPLSKPMEELIIRTIVFLEATSSDALLEKLAKLEHERRCYLAERWQINSLLRTVSYESLSEEQKEVDRVWARKILAIVCKEGQIKHENPTADEIRAEQGG